MKNEIVEQTVFALKHGGVVIFPTDTVWGVGASIEHAEGVRKLYEVKRRDPDKPTAVLVSDLIMAKRYGIFSYEAEELVLGYWPGGLTVVVPAHTHAVSHLICGESGAVGLRAANHPFVLSVLEQLGCGVVASSANFAQEPTPLRFHDIDQNLMTEVDYVVDGDSQPADGLVYESLGKEPSTVVDATSLPFRIIRQGGIQLNL